MNIQWGETPKWLRIEEKRTVTLTDDANNRHYIALPNDWHFEQKDIEELWNKKQVRIYKVLSDRVAIVSNIGKLNKIEYDTKSGKKCRFDVQIDDSKATVLSGDIFIIRKVIKQIPLKNIYYDTKGFTSFKPNETWINNINENIIKELQASGVYFAGHYLYKWIDNLTAGTSVYEHDDNLVVKLQVFTKYFKTNYYTFSVIEFDKTTGNVINITNSKKLNVDTLSYYRNEEIVAKMEEVRKWNDEILPQYIQEEFDVWADLVETNSIETKPEYNLIKDIPNDFNDHFLRGVNRHVNMFNDHKVALDYIIPYYTQFDIKQSIPLNASREDFNKIYAKHCGPFIKGYVDTGIDIRTNLKKEYEEKGLEELVAPYELNESFNMGNFKILKSIIRDAGGTHNEKAIVDNILILAFLNKDKSELDKDLRQLLRMYKEFFNITEHNISTVADFVVTHNLSDFYDDILVYDEGQKAVITKSKNPKLVKQTLEDAIARGSDVNFIKDSSFYFEQTLKIKGVEKYNPLNIVEAMKELIPEFNLKSDVALLTNIRLNADESFTYEFYTYSQKDGDFDGRRISYMTKLYNRYHPNDRIYFDYDNSDQEEEQED